MSARFIAASALAGRLGLLGLGRAAVGAEAWLAVRNC
jgi:hypothetical protein